MRVRRSVAHRPRLRIGKPDIGFGFRQVFTIARRNACDAQGCTSHPGRNPPWLGNFGTLRSRCLVIAVMASPASSSACSAMRCSTSRATSPILGAKADGIGHARLRQYRHRPTRWQIQHVPGSSTNSISGSKLARILRHVQQQTRCPLPPDAPAPTSMCLQQKYVVAVSANTPPPSWRS